MKKRTKNLKTKIASGKDPDIYQCFQNRIDTDGDMRLISCEDSIAIKQSYVWRGFLTKKGQPRLKLSWLEKLVILLREATTEEGYNHEWWGAEISKPDWMRNLDRKSENCWLYFPDKNADLTISVIGRRLGYVLTLVEYKMSRASSDPDFLKQWQAADLEEVKRDFPPEEADKIKVVIPGYESYVEFAESSRQAATNFRLLVMSFVEQQGLQKAHEFREAFSSGARKAFEVDLDNPLSDFNRREETFRILSEHWEEISTFKNRGELCRFLSRNFPPRARLKLEEAMSTKKDVGLWRNFTEFVRDTCDEIGLKLATRGRPKKNTDFSEE